MSDLNHLAERAAVAASIIEGLGSHGADFSRNWMGFNAFYQSFVTRNERQGLMSAVQDSISVESANSILSDCSKEIAYILRIPPGDMRYPSTSPEFRRQSAQDMATATHSDCPSPIRVAHLVAAVFQVRCNLFHGSKNPTTERSKKLIKASDKITTSVLAALFEVAAAPPAT